MVSAAQRRRDEEAAQAAELQDAKEDLNPELAEQAGDEQDAAPDTEGGLTPPVTREPDANPKDATAKRARRARRVVEAAPDPAADEHLRAEAAEVLGCHLEEVLIVEDNESEPWPVATTFDGQRYQLTGRTRGDFVWLQAKPAAAQILAGA